jgi:hypothetical protein
MISPTSRGVGAPVKIQKSELMRLVEQAAPGILDWTVGFVKAVIIDGC